MKEKAYRIISITSLLIIIILALMIFLFSSEDAKKSSDTSGKITNFVISIVYKDFDSLSDSEKLSIRSKTEHFVRKSAHFLEFFTLSFFLMVHVFSLLEYKRKKNLFSFLIVIPLGVIYAIFDEYHQFFVDGRGPMAKDVLIDSAGVLTGALIAFILLLIIKNSIIKKNNRKQEDI